MYEQLAKVALDLIANSSVRANDNDLAVVTQVRRMLTRIVAKELVVGEPTPEQPPVEPPK